jgi:hypothetical protein
MVALLRANGDADEGCYCVLAIYFGGVKAIAEKWGYSPSARPQFPAKRRESGGDAMRARRRPPVHNVARSSQQRPARNPASQ